MKKFFFYKKDLKRISKTNKNEFKIFVKKLIKMKLDNKIFFININNKIIKKNFCLETGWRHSVNSLYYLSRMSLKELCRSKLIMGLKKVSW